MTKSATASSNWQSEVNRSWGLAVVKTAYRDIYPNAPAETILEHSQTVEESMFQSAESKTGYDDSVSKAVDAIKILGATDSDPELSKDGNHTFQAGRTPRCATKQMLSNRHMTSTMKPMHDVSMIKTSVGRKSQSQVPNISRSQIGPSTGSKFILSKASAHGNMDSYRTRLDESDVIKLVPFVLEAGVLLIGKIESAEQATGISESQKSSIGFLAVQKMAHTLEIAAKNGFTVSLASKPNIQPLSVYDRELIIRRANGLRKEYMREIKSIYAKLGEKFDSPDCDETMLLNISNSLRNLEELEGDSCQVSKETAHSLDYVENVFKKAIEQYGTLVKGGELPSSGFRVSNRAGGNKGFIKSSAANVANTSYDPSVFGLGVLQNSEAERLRRFRRNGRGKEGEDDFSLHENTRPDGKSPDLDALILSHPILLAKYRGIVNELFPVVEAHLGKYSDAAQIRKQMAYARAFLKTKTVTNGEVLWSAEKTIDDFYSRFSHLLGEDNQGAAFEDETDAVSDWNMPLMRTDIWPSTWHEPVSPAEMTVPGPRRENKWDEVDVDDENSDETEEDEDGQKGEQMVKINFSDSEDEDYKGAGNQDAGEIKLRDSDEQTPDNKIDETEAKIGADYEFIFGPVLPEEPNTTLQGHEGEGENERTEEVGEEQAVEEVEMKQEPEEIMMKEEADVVEKAAESQKRSVKGFTPRRSQRSSVVAARVRRGGTPSRSSSSTARSTNAGQTTTPRSRGTPGMGLRGKKTPKKN